MSSHIGWPQDILLGTLFLLICLHASRNGQPRDGHYDLGNALIGAALEIAVLWRGGFFS